MNGFGLWPLFFAAERTLQRPGLNLPREAPHTWAWLCELAHHLEHQGGVPDDDNGLALHLADAQQWQRLRTVALQMSMSPAVLPPSRAGRIVAEHEQHPIERLRGNLPLEALNLPLGAHMRVLVEEMGRVFLEEMGVRLGAAQ